MRRALLGPVGSAVILAGALGLGSPTLGSTMAVVPPLAGIVIAVDPGHDGGNATHIAQISRRVWIGNRWKACDTAGTSTVSGYPEHRFTFAVALRVRARLQALGATVYMSRTSDTGYGPCIDARGKFGARVHAQLTVSIHGDGSGSTDRGFFVMKPGYVRGYTDDILARSATLAKAIRSGLLSAGVRMANYYATNGLATRLDMGTFNMSNVPVVMVELGNMKNALDASMMKSASGRDRYAAGLVAGIRTYLGK